MSELIHSAVLEEIRTCRLDSQQDVDLVDAGCNIVSGSQSNDGIRRTTDDVLTRLKQNTSITTASLQHGWEDYEPVDGTATLHPLAAQKNCGVMLSGWLYKTSRPKHTTEFTRAPHEHRQHRKFKLTEHSLEYNHLLQRVCLPVSF